MADSTSQPARVAHQPLHPQIRPTLDPQYSAYHDAVLQYIVPSQLIPWHPSIRSSAGPSGGSALRPVGRSYDLAPSSLGSELRVFEPAGEAPEGGWPVFVWYHGGGWVLGNLDSENNLLTKLCADAKAVVVSVVYRHAPEFVYPTAHDDALEALQWIVSTEGSAQLVVNPSRLAIGGTSAGANLSISVSLRASQLDPPISPIFQLAIIPVIDNTATKETEPWSLAPYAPWLTADRMTWYRRMYIVDPSQEKEWKVSPCLAPREVLEKCPRTWVAISECDLLKEEAVRFVGQLKEAGVEVESKVYEGSTHSILSLDAILDKGAEVFEDAARQLAQAFERA